MRDSVIRRKGNKKIVMLTAYDFQTAGLLAEAGVDLLLVGDSVGTVLQGQESTKQVTMEEMLYHTRAVVKGAGRVPVVSDMPIHSYDGPEEALRNARAFLGAGAEGVKIEGFTTGIVRVLTEAGIPVMGHLGLLPQTAAFHTVAGKTEEEADRIKHDADSLCAEGVFALVLECIPESLARAVTAAVPVPTIGIGAGRYCDGQVLVINDLLGMTRGHRPKFVKPYADLAGIISEAVRRFKTDVEDGRYPDNAHTYH
ncbi:MAG TPA: 3-methyl-2-oxobutanoate hydroxymethyltransferase [Spirochaetia bacterium]|nr:3-methyl-2-oxobutanoate hydroxymethyltransferase [Spirochaetia bacterium]